MSGDDVLCVRERVVDGQVLNDIGEKDVRTTFFLRF